MERILQAINKSPLFSIWMSALMALIALGAYGMLLSILFSMDVFKFHHAIPWTIKISTYIFFVGSGTGISMITSLGHIFGVKRFEFIGKRGAFLALITVIFGMMAIVLHLGHPERSFFFFLTPNIRSAIWGMSLFYTFAIPFIIVELWLLMRADLAKTANNSTGYKQMIYNLAIFGQRDESHNAVERDHKWAQKAAVVALIFELAAFSTLGSIFGHTQAKPYWHGAYFPLFFLLTAAYSGVAWLIGIIIATYHLQKKEMSLELKKLIFEMSNIFAVMVSASLLFIIYKIIAGLFDPAQSKSIMLMLTGNFSVSFWVFEITLGTIMPAALILYSLKRQWLGGLFSASVMALAGMFFTRYDFLITGQVYPYFNYASLPTVLPTLVESLVIGGIFGAFFLVYTLAIKFLPLEEKAH